LIMRACTPSACTFASSFSEILRPLPVCEAEMIVSVGSAAAAAAGGLAGNGCGLPADASCVRACMPGRLFWNAGMFDGAAAAAPAK
jgi:hypothetical protein